MLDAQDLGLLETVAVSGPAAAAARTARACRRCDAIKDRPKSRLARCRRRPDGRFVGCDCFGGAISAARMRRHRARCAARCCRCCSRRLLCSARSARGRRKTVDDYLTLACHDARMHCWQARPVALKHQHRQREQAFDRSSDELKTEIQKYRTADGQSARRACSTPRVAKGRIPARFLDSRLLSARSRADAVARRRCWSRSAWNRPTTSIACGCTAFPSIDPETVMELLQWRREVEQQVCVQSGAWHHAGRRRPGEGTCGAAVQDFAGPEDSDRREAARDAGRGRRRPTSRGRWLSSTRGRAVEASGQASFANLKAAGGGWSGSSTARRRFIVGAWRVGDVRSVAAICLT